jgi:hypothetical protein
MCRRYDPPYSLISAESAGFRWFRQSLVYPPFPNLPMHGLGVHGLDKSSLKTQPDRTHTHGLGRNFCLKPNLMAILVLTFDLKLKLFMMIKKRSFVCDIEAFA